MATVEKGFYTANKNSGSGDGSVTITASQNTGRNARSAETFLVTGAGTISTVSVSQKGAGNIWSSPASHSISGDYASGQTTIPLNISITTNASKIKWAWSDTPKTKVNGAFTGTPVDVTTNNPLLTNSINAGLMSNITNNTAISGDPGATAQYTAILPISFKKNQEATDVQYHLQIITSGTGNDVTHDIYITQTKANDFLIVSTTTLQLEASGAGKTFTIDSNTSWTIS